MVEQLHFMIHQPEIAYSETRTILRRRFGNPAILTPTSRPKIANSDAQAMQEFSDFLNQVNIASLYVINLRIFEYPSKIQSLVEKMPGWFKTSWLSKVQILQQMKELDAFPTFDNFVNNVTFHAGRLRFKYFSRKAKGYIKQFLLEIKYKYFVQKAPNNCFSQPAQTNQSNPSTVYCKFHNSSTHNFMTCQKFQDQSYQQKSSTRTNFGLWQNRRAMGRGIQVWLDNHWQCLYIRARQQGAIKLISPPSIHP